MYLGNSQSERKRCLAPAVTERLAPLIRLLSSAEANIADFIDRLCDMVDIPSVGNRE